MVNKLIILGRVGKVESRDVNGTPTCTVNIACTEHFKDKEGNKRETTEWIPCQAWRNNAENIVKYVKIGQILYIEGKYKTETWEKEGIKHYRTYCLVDRFQMVGDKKEPGQTTEPAQSKLPQDNFTDDDPSNDFTF